MNDAEIRQNFHRKKLQRQHAQKDTLVIDELGLNHGKCRADIAVVNGHFVGYEIKSNRDSLRRLEGQVKSYNAVFDKISIIVGDRYINSIQSHIPEWWGVIVSVRGLRGAVNFRLIREAQENKSVNPVSIAKLLWRDEAIEILRKSEIPNKILRQPRLILYEYIANILNICELRKTVRNYFKKRRNWRCHELPSRYDGLGQSNTQVNGKNEQKMQKNHKNCKKCAEMNKNAQEMSRNGAVLSGNFSLPACLIDFVR